MLCLPILTEVVVEKKVIELKKRIQYISICVAVISCLGSVSTSAFYINFAPIYGFSEEMRNNSAFAKAFLSDRESLIV
jgi:hypothetical protein